MKTKNLTPILLGIATLSPLHLAIAQEGENLGLEEIVVTATRRAERLQDVPLAVSAVSGEQLKATAFKDLTDIQYAISGVQFGETPNDSGFRVRGIGTLGGFTSSSETPVGTVVDNVVIGIGSPIQSLGDIERIEVLKGPQGTQFGKNASSGVINITTKSPDTSGFSGNVYGSYATLSEHDVHGSLNIPLTDTTAMNVYVFDREHDGFVDNVVRNEEWGGVSNSGMRIKLLSELSDSLSLNLITDYSKEEQNGPNQTWTLNKLASGQTAPFSPFGAPFVDLVALGVTPNDENDISIEDGEGFGESENYGVSFQFDKELGDYTFSSITAWREQKRGESKFSIDGAPYARFRAFAKESTQRFVSQELRLTSPDDDAFEYTAGLYVAQQKTGMGDGQSATLAPAQPFAPTPVISISAGFGYAKTTSDSSALFIDGKYHFTENLSLLGGLRLTRDEVEAETATTVDTEFAMNTIPYAPRPLQKDSTEETDISGRLGLEYRHSNDMMFYGTYARGYLGPTVTYSILSGTKSDVAPQTVDDFTFGMKSQFLDRRLTFNANVFYDDFNDLQTSVFDGVEFLTENAGGAETKGFEFDVTFLATSNLIVNLSYTYSDAQFTDYITDCPTPIVLAGNEVAQCNAPGSTVVTSLFQAEGEALPNAPKHSAVLGFNYNNEIFNNFLFDISGNASFRSETQNDVADDNTNLDGYTLVNLSAGLEGAEQNWRLGLFVRNLFDTNYNAGIISLPFAAGGSYVNWRVRNAQRTSGVEFSYNF